MKRLLFLLLLVSQIAYGQKVTTYGGKALTYGGDVATYAYCDEYQAVYDAYTVKPSDATAAVWNTFVTKCVATGEWAALDVLWNYAGVSDNTNGEALINWKLPGTFDATAYNAPTFTALEGFTGNGTTQYIDCNWNPSVNGVNYVRNSASMIIYVRTNIAADGQHGIGNAADFKNIFILPKYTIDNSYIRTNDATTISGANSDGSGMFINTRTASTVNKLYKNKVAIINATSVSTGMPTHLAYCLAINDDDVATGFRADQVSMYAFGGGMTQTQVTNLTTYYEAAMDALGKGVIP